ncbi:MAG: hypothetical protein JSW00_10390 [Thermoplasmata archaeon]|nr:MAG: hypothetical protein JSW00_10390 [Thermoplasmata archaeon]
MILTIGIILVIGLWLTTLTYLVLAKKELRKEKAKTKEPEESQKEEP